MAPGSESITSGQAHPSLAGSLVGAVLDRAMELAASTDVAPSTGVHSLHQLANDDPQVLREALALAEQCLTGSDPSGVGARATSLLRFSLDRHLWTQRWIACLVVQAPW